MKSMKGPSKKENIMEMAYLSTKIRKSIEENSKTANTKELENIHGMMEVNTMENTQQIKDVATELLRKKIINGQAHGSMEKERRKTNLKKNL